MSRWNISAIFFLGEGGRRREIKLVPRTVNIITGGSGTGKSTLIKVIDYCLGSEKCELPVHVRRRCLAVGVKWTDGSAEMVVGRIVPMDGHRASTKMFVDSGRNLPIPGSVREFRGVTNLGQARLLIERAFGIGDLKHGSDEEYYGSPSRATVRYVTPYIFVSKGVIDSETVLLHGMDEGWMARGIVETMPYFLGITDEASAADMRRLRVLRAELDRENRRLRTIRDASGMFGQRASGLWMEAYRLGLVDDVPVGGSDAQWKERLKSIPWDGLIEEGKYPGHEELVGLQVRREKILIALATLRRRSQAARTAVREATGFQRAVTRQYEKVKIAEHLQLDQVSATCPVCRSSSTIGAEMADALRETLRRVEEESADVERVKPKFVEYDAEIDKEIRDLNGDLNLVDQQLQSWFQQTEESKRLLTLSNRRAHVLGRISSLLETTADFDIRPEPDLRNLRSQIDEIEVRQNHEAREQLLRRAERKISEHATRAFRMLPTVAPCSGSELEFWIQKPEVTILEAGTGSVLRLADIGSDQNYLAIHLALSFALQRYLGEVGAPVPGLLVLDQISRPYFPPSGEDYDETEIGGPEESDDVVAMRKLVDFLFSETNNIEGLQVLLIEHAYFSDDNRYVSATRARWTKASGEALIPGDWPLRANDRKSGNDGVD